jgi:predicted RNA-binding Zn ribbon-like protein
MVMTSWPPRFLFIGGSLAVDFIHTGGEGDRAVWERWTSTRDLEDWIQACPHLAVRLSVAPPDLVVAKDLREAIWAVSQAVLGRQVPPHSAIARVESVAAKPDLVPAWKQGRMQWSAETTVDQVLSSVARDALAVFGTDLVQRFRQCAGPNCTLMFVDHSRAGRRQWCAMERCGNLTKVARHRAKEKGEPHARRAD